MIYLLLGPSGSGKTTLGAHLKEMGIPELISHSTRQPRPGEYDENPYYFVTHEQFALIPMIESTEYNGNLYGTSRQTVDFVLNFNNHAFAIVDKHGCEEFKRLYADSVKVIYVYVSPDDVWDRMILRGDKPRDVHERIVHAEKTGEFNNLEIADYCIVNKDLQASIRQLKAIVEG